MSNKSMLEKLALPMFATGVLAMILSASISVSATANASDPVAYKKVTLNYLSSGYSANSSSCGSYQDSYGNPIWNTPSFSARDSSNSTNQKLFLCQATVYVVTGVQMPTPTPVPTVTVIYKTASPAPSPAWSPKPTYKPQPTTSPKPNPTFRPTYSPSPMPTRYYKPVPTPSKPSR